MVSIPMAPAACSAALELCSGCVRIVKSCSAKQKQMRAAAATPRSDLASNGSVRSWTGSAVPRDGTWSHPSGRRSKISPENRRTTTSRWFAPGAYRARHASSSLELRQAGFPVLGGSRAEERGCADPAVEARPGLAVGKLALDGSAEASGREPHDHSTHDHSTHATDFNGDVEEYKRPDPTLPAPPAGDGKKFRLDVYEHVTKVSDDQPATRVWSYAVNGKFNRGTGVSEPMVVTEGDEVEITLVNGGSKEMDVRMPHSIDYHSSEVAPNEAFKTIQPGETHQFSFTAEHPGVFMYHCATDPVLMHTGAGMVGMMVVKPKDLAPVDRELWMTQQEFYLGEPGKEADLAKMEAKAPDTITFNGYASQYADHPISVERGERVRMYVLNAGPSVWSAFHVIGTVFDRAVTDNGVANDVQTVNLRDVFNGVIPSTGEGADLSGYPFCSGMLTPVHTNPALTAMANALRVGDHLLERLGLPRDRLVRAQRAALASHLDNLASLPTDDDVTALWRHHSAAAVAAFLEALGPAADRCDGPRQPPFPRTMRSAS